MVCYHPLTGYRAPNGGPISFSPKKGYVDRPIKIGCGQCIGCRLEKSRVWAVRCMHEAQLYEDNCFITLTYSDENLPKGNSLVKNDFVLFHKRLRDRVGYGRFRFYACGEYGDRYGRPHYHAIIFNYDFPDKEFYRTTPRGDRLYTSEFLDRVWGLGHCQIGSVSFESAAYVARYVTKKVTGDVAEDYYGYYDLETGEIFQREPEFGDMSRRPGIGRGFFERFSSDIFPRDYAVVNGVKMRPPRYYGDLYEVSDADAMRRIKAARVRKAKLNSADSTPDRLKVRERLAEIKLGLKPSTLE